MGDGSFMKHTPDGPCQFNHLCLVLVMSLLGLSCRFIIWVTLIFSWCCLLVEFTVMFPDLFEANFSPSTRLWSELEGQQWWPKSGPVLELGKLCTLKWFCEEVLYHLAGRTIRYSQKSPLVIRLFTKKYLMMLCEFCLLPDPHPFFTRGIKLFCRTPANSLSPRNLVLQ